MLAVGARRSGPGRRWPRRRVTVTVPSEPGGTAERSAGRLLRSPPDRRRGCRPPPAAMTGSGQLAARPAAAGRSGRSRRTRPGWGSWSSWWWPRERSSWSPAGRVVVVVLVVVVSARPTGRSSGRMGVYASSLGSPQPPGAATPARDDGDAAAPLARRRSAPAHPGSAGNETTKRAPPPGRSSTHAAPPWTAACSATRARPEAGADAVTGGRAPGEALEDAGALGRRHARAGVLDDQVDRAVGAVLDGDRASGRRRAARRCRGGWRGSARGGACRPAPAARPSGGRPETGTLSKP